MPSTSVNLASTSPYLSWDKAVQFCEESTDIYIPRLESQPHFSGAVSSLVKIHEDGSYTFLRQGAVGEQEVQQALGTL
ncbi:MAG: hypothetical protein KA436_05005 [Oligoflexales bacterium]|nr:hypothetical protein [Oligoflexales bacterium]